MKRKELFLAIIFFIALTAGFFYKVFLHGYVPIPGDLLVREYSPWKAYSYLGYVPGSFPEKAQYFDVIRQLYPWKTLSIELLKSGKIPLWNPYNFSGAPLLANFQSAIFYPLNIFYLLFSQVKTWTFLIMLQPFLSGFFMYLFARKIGIGRIGSMLSSIAFSCSLFSTVFLEYGIIGHTIVWLPPSLYLVEEILENLKPWKIILLVASLVLAFLAGHIQIAGFVWLFILIYIVCRISMQSWEKNKKIFTTVFFLMLFVAALGIGSFQLFPTIELINNSARVVQSYQFLLEKLLLQPQQMILFLSPDFFGNPASGNYLINDTYPGNAIYVGITPFLFALFAFIKFKTNYFIRFFSIAAIVLLFIFMRSPLTEVFYRLQIPLFSTGSPTNGIFLLSFCLSVLSGFGFDLWFMKHAKSHSVIVFAIAGIFLAVWAWVTTIHPQTISSKNFLYSTILYGTTLTLFLIGIFFIKKKLLIGCLFLFLTIFDLFYFFHKFNPFVPEQLVFPQAAVFNYLKEQGGLYRFWGYGGATIEANFTSQYKLFSPGGYDPLYPRRYGEFIQSSKEGKIETGFTNRTRSDAVIAPGFGEEDLPSNNSRLRVLDALGVKYVMGKQGEGDKEKTFPRNRFRLVYEKDGWQVFENLKAAPRFFLTSDYKKFKTKDEFEQLFFANNFDPSRTILLEGNLPQLLSSQKEGSATVNSYSPNEASFATKTDGDMLFFLSDTYYLGWKALLDGKETTIYRANYTFRAVLVPKGEHTVIFQYAPQSFSLGVKTTIISIVILMLFTVILRSKAFVKHYEK